MSLLVLADPTYALALAVERTCIYYQTIGRLCNKYTPGTSSCRGFYSMKMCDSGHIVEPYKMKPDVGRQSTSEHSQIRGLVPCRDTESFTISWSYPETVELLVRRQKRGNL